jgi:gliding motility-associated-like protein
VKKIIAICSIYFFFNYTIAQNLIWSENFSSGSANWALNILSGFNGPDDPNIWVINDNEGGVLPPGCGVANNGNNTLHITCQGFICTLLGASGAVYNAGGIGDVTTDVRAAYTTPISTINQTNLEYRFNWIGVGQAGLDFAEAEYSIDGGATWNVIWTQTPGATCAGGQGQWTEEIINLPVNAENQPDLRFAFRWRNNNDGAGSDPSFAVDELRLFAATPAGPTADFSVVNTTICEGDCIDFTDNSTGVNISDWSWDFGGGGTPNTSSDQNPSNICFASVGSFNVALTVTDDNGTDSAIETIEVIACPTGPTADFSVVNTTICEGDCIDFTDNSTGVNISDWSWDFGGGGTPNTSSDQNPSNICFASVGSFNVALTVTDDNGTDSAIETIEVIACPTGPAADFSVVNTTICEGDCIDFTDNSTGVNISDWSWDFGGGGTPNTSSDQNPNNICFASVGSFNVALTVTDDNGTDSTIETINVISCASGPTAQFSLPIDTICVGDCINFQDNSIGNNISAWSWDFGSGALPSTSNEANPNNICFNTSGNVVISLTVTDENGTDNVTQVLIVEDCPPSGNPPTASFSFSGLTCVGECIDFVDNSFNNPTSWEWTFDGASPSSSNSQNPQNICFNAPGNYNVSLTVSNEFGSQTINDIVTITPLPSITVFADTTIALGGTATLEVFTTSVGNLSWNPLDGLDCSDCAIVDASPDLPTMYIATITDANGCSNSDSVFVNIDFQENIGVPSAFSPNGDNFNDVLFVKGEGIQTMVFRIFNRYGQLVFSSTDQSVGWDGKMNGTPLNQGVFAYTLEYTLFNGVSGSQTGNVTLIR